MGNLVRRQGQSSDDDELLNGPDRSLTRNLIRARTGLRLSDISVSLNHRFRYIGGYKAGNHPTIHNISFNIYLLPISYSFNKLLNIKLSSSFQTERH